LAVAQRRTRAWQQGVPLALIVAVHLWRVLRPRVQLPPTLQRMIARRWIAAAKLSSRAVARLPLKRATDGA